MSKNMSETELIAQDKKELADFRREKMTYNSSVEFWKPEEGDGNQIRILPGFDGAHFHFKMAKHWIQHDDGWEVFVCNKITYGKSCSACEEFDRLLKAGMKEESRRFKPETKGIFNVIDRNNEKAGVRIWEAPPVAVWTEVLSIYTGNSLFKNLIKTEDDPNMGRDLVVKFDPKAQPSSMYAIRPLDLSKLGSDKQVKKWFKEAKPLKVEVLYPEITYEASTIKTFGSPIQRADLKREMERAAVEVEKVEEPKTSGDEVKDIRDKVEEIRAKHEADNDTEKEPKVEKTKEDKEVAELKKKLAEAEAKVKAEEPTKEGKIAVLKEKLKSAEDDEFDSILAEINELKK